MILKNIKQADVFVQQTFLEVPISLKPISRSSRKVKTQNSFSTKNKTLNQNSQSIDQSINLLHIKTSLKNKINSIKDNVLS